ncbi:TolC family protein [Dyadobacter tibetensis]|uniref:TolC family protein n=1 Tax=Dyadobacter tibetensis TaxID=1211851 RepID=UPI0004B9D222|nr:TolC family protein [Dyadobacter tibetensis]
METWNYKPGSHFKERFIAQPAFIVWHGLRCIVDHTRHLSWVVLAPMSRFTLLPFLLISFSCFSQKTLSLHEAISLAQSQSPFYHRAKNTYERSYWQFSNFKAGFKPQIRLNATVPTFYRAINPITQPDGSIQFVRVSQANNSLGLSVLQNIGFTGGTLQAGTSLQRTDNFSGNQSSYFLSTPIQLSYTQNSLLYNDFYWKRKLEPVLFETAGRGYAEDMELTSLEAVKLFLEGLEAQVAIDITEANQAQADTLYNLSQERFAIGTVPRTDLLQLELNMLKAKSELNDNRIAREEAIRSLKRVLGLGDEDRLHLLVPSIPEEISISYEKALEQAQFNRPAILKFRSERLQADQEVARAKGQNSLELSLIANLGTQQTAARLGDSYRGLQNQQYIGVTLDVPIQDWGYRKSQIRLAQANRELVEVNMQQEELIFEQEIYMQVLRFNQKYSQLQIAGKADTVAQQRLAITKERYLLGKLTIPDLNLALQESVTAKRGFIQALSDYWLLFYTLRRLTLYDFLKNEPLKYKKE